MDPPARRWSFWTSSSTLYEKSIMRQRVIHAFDSALDQAIKGISAKYVTESQKQNLNLSTDIVIIPTGDGAAIPFPFQRLQNIHLDFA
jgi:hypothetical protein